MQPKKGYIFLALLSMSAVALLWAFDATPYDGPWAGTGISGYPVSFTVSGGGTAWSDFKYKLDVYCEHYGVSSTMEFTTPGPGTITDGQFSFSSGGIAFTGSFDTPTTASGTWSLTDYSWVIPLPPPTYVHVHTLNYSGTWTAMFNGTLPTISVTSPNGGESWTAGSTHDITWTTTGSMANVKLELSTNSGADWTAIAASTANTGAYSWPVPPPASASCLIRASDASNAGISDTSDAVFAITSASIPGTERQALIALYDSTNGDSWTNNTGWKMPPLDSDGFALPGTEGTWFGVTLDGTPRVTSIYLAGNQLSGALPVELGNLNDLRTLVLSNNLVGGSIPAELGGLVNLAYLYLRGNQLSGPIPAELGDLANLIILDLASNQLSGSIPADFGGLTSLDTVFLDSNLLTGTIPDELRNMASLRQLILNSNQLTGSIPAWLGSMANLQEVMINSNQLSGSIPAELGLSTSIRALHLWSNLLTGAIPPELGNMTNLRILALRSNQLTGTIPAELGDLANLLHLYLENNQLSGPIPIALGDLANLYTLGLSGNQLEGPIPVELGNLTNLLYLWLNSNRLSGSIPAELGGSTKLEFLMVNANKLSGTVPTSLMSLVSLNPAHTDLGNNSFSASDPDLIAFLNTKDADWASTQTIAPAGTSRLRRWEGRPSWSPGPQ